MWFRNSATRRLQNEIKSIEAGLSDLRAEECLVAARQELKNVRSGATSASLAPSITKLEYRKQQLEGDLRAAWQRRNLVLCWLGAGVWTIAGIYGMVWLHTMRHPEWAIATTVALWSMLGFIILGGMMLWQFALWMEF